MGVFAKALVVVVACYALTTVTALSAGAERRHRMGASLSASNGAASDVDVPDSMPVDVFATLEKRGAWTITALVIQRTPIQSFIPKVLNFLSGGKWRDALDAAGGYDKMFHLAVVATVQSPDGKQTEYWKVEKSPNVEMTKVDAKATDAQSPEAVKARLEQHAFTVAPNTKLQDLFRDAKTTKGFWLYDAFNRPPYDKNGGNCQDFVRRILTTISPGGQLPTATTEWVFQDGVTIGEKLGWFSRAVAKGLTNTGAMVDVVKDTIAHPMVKARQIKAGNFIALKATAHADDEDEAQDEAEAEAEDEDEAQDEAEDEAEGEAEDEAEGEDEAEAEVEFDSDESETEF